MNEVQANKSRSYFPFLEKLYAILEPLAYPLVRVSLGAILIPHGYDKIFHGGYVNAARNAVFQIFGEPMIGAYFIGLLEFFGGLMLIAGLFTRVIAAGVFIQMMVISFVVLWPNWGWSNRGMEFALFMGLIALAIAFRGGGAYSLDAKMKKEF